MGKIPFAPGTFGSILGLLPCYLLAGIGFWPALIVIIFFIFFSIWISGKSEKILNQKDPGCIVIDEIAGMMVTFIGLPFTYRTAVAGFLVFRILDILKPFPIRYLENRVSGGSGIVIDDVAAGLIGNILLRIIIHYIGMI